MREFDQLEYIHTIAFEFDCTRYKYTASNKSDFTVLTAIGRRLPALKKIEAVVRREIFPDIDGALKQAGISGLTFFDAEGRGRSKGREMVSGRGARTYQTEYVERTKLEIIVKDPDASKVIEIILAHAKTGASGDGKIFVSSVEEVYDITSGLTGEESIKSDEQQTYAVAKH